MDKILVVVDIPLIDETYNVWIPINQKIGNIKHHIIEAINELTDNDVALSDKTKLYNKDTSIDYQNDIYVKDSGIKNGAKLILM